MALWYRSEYWTNSTNADGDRCEKNPQKSTSTHKHSQKHRDRDNEGMQLKENHIRKRGETERLAKQQTQQYIQKHISIHFGLWRQPNE